MVIDKDTWLKAIDWTIENEGKDCFEIRADGKFLYNNSRNKIRCACEFEQLIYRFKLEKLLPEDLFYLIALTKTSRTGKKTRSYYFTLKGKETFKNKHIRIQCRHLFDALMKAKLYDETLPDKKG